MAQTETERLTQVYHGYLSSAAVRSRWSDDNPGNRAIRQEREHAAGRLLAAAGLLPLGQRRVLDIGCGSGVALSAMARYGVQPQRIYGIDLLPVRVAEAGRRFPRLALGVANAAELPFAAEQFDLVMLFTVLSSVLDQQMAQAIAQEATRVLRPGGQVLWYDFRYPNPRNPHVRGLPQARLHALFPTLRPRLSSVTLLPPLARRLGQATPLVYPLLASLPLLRTHYLALLEKPR